MRKIPSTMATQHPDNADCPYWYKRPFISAAAEIEECYRCFYDLGIDEYNWDWEGKFVDEAVVDRLLHTHLPYFRKHPLGDEKFLTFRIPNPRIEKQFRLARAFMVVVTSSQLSQSLGFTRPPIFETILPLTESAQEIIDIQEAFRELIGIEHKLLRMEESIRHIEIIPLFEQVETIIKSAEILKKYIHIHHEKFGYMPEYIRPYCARSDPALNSGLVPTILALKLALSQYMSLQRETGVKLFPMLGTGSLPFRGGLNPESLDTALEEYAGVRTLTVQSAFRYDYPKKLVQKALKRIRTHLPQKVARYIPLRESDLLNAAIPHFEKPYRLIIEAIAPLINRVSMQVARRRERMQHVGLFGYSRGVGKVRLPRAIPFTASLYSLGIPPELIGTGRGLRAAHDRGNLESILHTYTGIKDDMMRAGYFLNRMNLQNLAQKYPACHEILSDVRFIEEILDIELGPRTKPHIEHRELTGKIYERMKDGKDVSPLITITGAIRKSLG
jgi:phosphoenolpyruvate carboxylase